MTTAAALTRLRGINDHVPQLARGAVGARKHPAVKHDACTDAGAERHEHEAAVARAGALPQLSHGSRVGVVEEAHIRTGESGLQCIVHAQ